MQCQGAETNRLPAARDARLARCADRERVVCGVCSAQVAPLAGEALFSWRAEWSVRASTASFS